MRQLVADGILLTFILGLVLTGVLYAVAHW